MKKEIVLDQQLCITKTSPWKGCIWRSKYFIRYSYICLEAWRYYCTCREVCSQFASWRDNNKPNESAFVQNLEFFSIETWLLFNVIFLTSYIAYNISCWQEWNTFIYFFISNRYFFIGTDVYWKCHNIGKCLKNFRES